MGLQLIAENAEKTLLEAAKTIMALKTAVRCIHLPLMEKNPAAEGTKMIMSLVESTTGDPDAVIYSCEDGDIFVLSRMATRKSLFSLVHALPPTLAPARPTGPEQIFEVHIEGQRLVNICERKLDAILTKRKKEELEAIEEASKTQQHGYIQIDKFIAEHPRLIETLEERRKSRGEPLILVVEDDLFSQRLVGNILNKDYKIIYAATGREGLVSHLMNAPDMIFLDINLPDLTGHEILERLFRIDPNAFIVMLSGNGSRENVMKSVEGGAKGFVGKPFAPEKLKRTIERCPFIKQKTL